MKTRIFCIALCILTILLTLGGVKGMQDAMQPHGQNIATVLRMACYADEDNPSMMTARYFSGLVNQKTNGRILIEVISGCELGDESAAIEQMGFGGIAFSVIDCLSLPDSMLAGGAVSSMTISLQALDQQRLDILGSFGPDYRCIASSKALITSKEECEGVSICAYTAKLLTDRLRDCGFTIVPYSGDLISSVYYGYVDSVEMSLMTYATEDYAKAMPYLTFYNGPLAPDVLLASQVSLGNLSSDDQRIIRQCALEAARYQRTIIAEQQEIAIANLKAVGVKFYPPEISNISPTDWNKLRSRFIGGGDHK